MDSQLDHRSEEIRGHPRLSIPVAGVTRGFGRAARNCQSGANSVSTERTERF